MPVVQPPCKVLVSGASGYIATWVVRTLLEKGYSVRGTVRSEEKATHLRKLFDSYGDKHEVVIVEDMTKVRIGQAARRYKTGNITMMNGIGRRL
jgi:uncharacterized protein YbjT (DUF2867 family)